MDRIIDPSGSNGAAGQASPEEDAGGGDPGAG